MGSNAPLVSSDSTRSVKDTSMDFGKFYATSFLDMNSNVIKKGPPLSPNLRQPANFHRPENFTYNKTPKVVKKRKSGLVDILTGKGEPKVITAGKGPDTDHVRTKSLERPPETEEVIKLSHFPSAHQKKDVPAIERDDWPAPPASAFITRSLVHAALTQRQASNDSDEEDSQHELHQKLQHEIEEISKIQNSAMVKVIRDDVVEQLEHDKKRSLDPRSASRSPAANKEPVQPPRFISPINASPSRSLVDRPKAVQDDGAQRAKSPTDVIHSTVSHKYRVKPGYSYGYLSKSLSSVPPGTPGAYVYDAFNGYDSDDGVEENKNSLDGRINVVDLVTRVAAEDGESVCETIPYSELNLQATHRRKGLNLSTLEKYLSGEEFEKYLGMTREEFYKQPEFKRNDIKRKVFLF